MWASSAVIIFFGTVFGLLFVRRGLDAWERNVALGALGMHFLCAYAQIWIIEHLYEGVTDAAMYAEHGRLIAHALEVDFVRWAPEVVRLGLHLDNSLPFYVFGEGWGTGTVSAITGCLFFLFGDHLLPVALAISIFAWFGQISLFHAARGIIQTDDRHVAMIATVAVPSVIFWSSTLAKEALVIGWFGILALGIQRTLITRRPWSLVQVVVGAVGVAILKPYVLFPLVLGVGAAMAFGRFRPLYALIGTVVAIAGMLALGELFPEYGLSQLAERTAEMQRLGASVGKEGGGSYVEVGDAVTDSVGGQIRFVPLALLNTFFRPSIIDVRNLTSFGAAVEMTALSIVTLALILRGRPILLVQAIFADPALTFCATFTLSFALAVGLATTNLGTLSRYRVPMMPFYVAFVLLLNRRLRHRSAATEAIAT